MDIIVILATIGSIVGTLMAAYSLIKGKLRKLRELVDEIDNALIDDAVTEAEFALLITKLKALVK